MPHEAGVLPGDVGLDRHIDLRAGRGLPDDDFVAQADEITADGVDPQHKSRCPPGLYVSHGGAIAAVARSQTPLPPRAQQAGHNQGQSQAAASVQLRQPPNLQRTMPMGSGMDVQEPARPATVPREATPPQQYAAHGGGNQMSGVAAAPGQQQQQ